MDKNKNFFERMFCKHEINVYENQEQTSTSSTTDTRRTDILLDSGLNNGLNSGLNSGLGDTISSLFAISDDDENEVKANTSQTLDTPLFSVGDDGEIDGMFVVGKDEDSNDDISLLDVEVDDYDVTKISINDINDDGDLEDDIVKYLKSSNLNNLSDDFENTDVKETSEDSDDDLDMPLL